MINIARFVVGPLQENCYVISDDTLEAVIIDDGAFYDQENDQILQYIDSHHLVPVRLLATHAHFDHIIGTLAIHDRYGLNLDFSADDSKLYHAFEGQTEAFLNIRPPHPLAPQGVALKHNDSVTFGKHTIDVIATPGHSPGGLCFYLKDEQTLLSGDSLFRYSIGRTDFPDGNGEALLSSLRTRIMTLPDDVKVLPGHGSPTTIGDEKAGNPYITASPF